MQLFIGYHNQYFVFQNQRRNTRKLIETFSKTSQSNWPLDKSVQLKRLQLAKLNAYGTIKADGLLCGEPSRYHVTLKSGFRFLFKTNVNSSIKSQYNKLTVQAGMCLKQNFLIFLKTCILLVGLMPSLFLLALPPQGHALFS